MKACTRTAVTDWQMVHFLVEWSADDYVTSTLKTSQWVRGPTLHLARCSIPLICALRACSLHRLMEDTF